jgi:hypothetical protein
MFDLEAYYQERRERRQARRIELGISTKPSIKRESLKKPKEAPRRLYTVLACSISRSEGGPARYESYDQIGRAVSIAGGSPFLPHIHFKRDLSLEDNLTLLSNNVLPNSELVLVYTPIKSGTTESILKRAQNYGIPTIYLYEKLITDLLPFLKEKNSQSRISISEGIQKSGLLIHLKRFYSRKR